MAHDVVMSDESPHKRKRPLEDMGGRDQKKAHIEDSRFSIENLHLDVGEKFLLCKTRKAPSILSAGSLTPPLTGRCSYRVFCLVAISDPN
jgi:hypothetical protein